MARYLLLSISDNETAENIAEYLSNGTDVVYLQPSEVKLLGMYAQPTMFCNNCSSGRRVRSYTRGKKYGWWVCTVCKKPSNVGEIKTARAVVSQGVNLLLDMSSEVVTDFDGMIS